MGTVWLTEQHEPVRRQVALSKFVLLKRVVPQERMVEAAERLVQLYEATAQGATRTPGTGHVSSRASRHRHRR
jgi:hypothetical protein